VRMQVKAKYSANMAELFHETFCWLPLAFVMNGGCMQWGCLCQCPTSCVVSH